MVEALHRIESNTTPTRRCLFLAGMKETTKSIEPITQTLIDFYGEGNVKSFNSVLSSDQIDELRFQNMAHFITDSLKDNGKLTIVAHSFGAVELAKVFRDFGGISDEQLRNIDVVLISPSGFFPRVHQGIRFLSRVTREGSTKPDTSILSRLPSVYRSIASTVLIPIAGLNLEEQSACLRIVFPKQSQRLEDSLFSPVNQSSLTNFKDKLEPDQQSNLEDIDSKLKCLARVISQTKGPDLKKCIKDFKVLLKQRAKLLKKVMSMAYQNDFEEKRKKQKVDLLKHFATGELVFFRLLIDSVLGIPYKQFLSLAKAGVKFKFIVPEYDLTVGIDEIAGFYKQLPDKMPQTPVLSGQTHSSLILRPENLCAALKMLYQEQSNLQT